MDGTEAEGIGKDRKGREWSKDRIGWERTGPERKGVVNGAEWTGKERRRKEKKGREWSMDRMGRNWRGKDWIGMVTSYSTNQRKEIYDG